ncbi:MAG: hypothetical protein ACM3XS_03660 [Bacteroidota bacterium]
MAVNLHFTEEDWARVERDWAAWWAGELPRPLVMVESVDPVRAANLPPFVDFASNFPLHVPADEVLDHYQAHLEARRYHGDAFPKWWPNFGPGIAAGFLGARVHSVPETVWFEPAEEIPLESLHFRYDPENPWWRRVYDLTARAVERWGGMVSVAHTDLGGNLDILASFRTTQRLLLDLYDAPEEVARLAGEITRLWLRYYDELHALIARAGRGTTPWAAIRSAGRCYMLQCDLSYMISPAMFERFVLPDLAACCDRLDHGFYHLDGKGEIPHLDMLLSLERLRGIQWVPGDGAPPPEEWLPLLKRIRDAGKLCQVFVSPAGARRIARELGGQGFVFHVGLARTADEAEDLARTIAAEGRGR